ncbi:TonB-dependent receptor plug domain-containing protein [Parvularcula bermudensis]|uniref:TonB-dependent receptor plug domain-containing protein n=1 Tax=Parvularcula bermudensis TaxID=208216 RepID=UPI0013050F55|nr:TonB-dependent receptor [Parvularcula bermudensis]
MNRQFHLLGAGVAALMTAIPAMASAQETAGASNDVVVVTGSKIPREDLEGPSPVAVFGEQQIDRSGAVSIGRLLREIPSVAGAGETRAINNSGAGSQEVSLRGLGSQRTLVLINGRRVPDSSAGLEGQVDLNTIPVSLIERVEVLKDGASTVYGADAVAGVVNVILRRDFEGIALDYQKGISEQGDAEQDSVSLTLGDTFDKGNFVINFSLTEEGEVSAGDREFSKQARDIELGELIPGGSSAPPWGRYFVTGGPEPSVTLGPDYSGGPFFGYQGFQFAEDAYNFAPINHQAQPLDRWSATFIANYDVDVLSDGPFFLDTELFTEVSYVDRQSQQQLAEVPLAPLAFFGFDAPYSADNGYNPFGQEISDWRRRIVETGGRTDDVQVKTFRTVLGARGELPRDWSWEFSYSYGDVDRTSSFFPIIDLNKTALAVGPTAMDGDGVLRCDTDSDGDFTDADDQTCVPLDVFGENSITPEMIDYIAITQNESTEATSEIFALDLVNPSIFTLPAGDVGIAVGYVHRSEEGTFTPDSQVAALGGAATGTPSQATVGGYELDEFFGEVRVPILADRPLADELTVEAGIRWSDYDTFGDTTNYKVGLTYRPVSDVLLRGSVNTAFRAPQIEDLFGGAEFSFPSTTDPCASNPSQFCIDDGVPPGGFDQLSSQVRTIEGGNVDLQPEEADIFTVGAVYTPSQIPGLALGLDYYDYEITDAITTIGASVILQECAATGEFCELIDRLDNPGEVTDGAPILVDNRTTNVGQIETQGVDFFIEYVDIPAGPGEITARLQGTYTDTFDLTQANGTVVPHAGYFRDDNEGHFAKLRLNSELAYTVGGFTGSITGRFIDSVEEFGEDLFGSCVNDGGFVITPGVNAGLTCVGERSSLAASPVDVGKFHRRIEAVTYWDVYAEYLMPIEQVETILYMGIDNLLDEQPPLSVDGFNDNTDVRTYDTIGRFLYGGIRTKF